MDIDNGLITTSKASSVWQMEKTSVSEAYKLAIPLPEVLGYKWGWIRFALGGYTHNESPEKDDKNLNSATDKGWMPVVRSPHERLPLNKAGYVTAGDLVLCIKRVDENMAGCVFLVKEMPICPYCKKITQLYSDENFVCDDCNHLIPRKREEKMIEITENDSIEIYDRNEILCENGMDVDFRKATHRIINHDSAIGNMYVNQVRDLRAGGSSWITLPGVYPNSIKADDAYQEFKENFELDGGLVVEKGRIYQLIDGVVKPKDEEV